MKIYEYFLRTYLEENNFVGMDFVKSSWFKHSMSADDEKRICTELELFKNKLDKFDSYEIKSLTVGPWTVFRDEGNIFSSDKLVTSSNIYTSTSGWITPGVFIKKSHIGMPIDIIYDVTNITTKNEAYSNFYEIGKFKTQIDLKLNIEGFVMAENK